MRTQNFYFARTTKAINVELLTATIVVKETPRGFFKVSVEGLESQYLENLIFDNNKFETEEQAIEAAKKIAAIAKEKGYFQTTQELTIDDVNTLMQYREREDIKELLIDLINR